MALPLLLPFHVKAYDLLFRLLSDLNFEYSGYYFTRQLKCLSGELLTDRETREISKATGLCPCTLVSFSLAQAFDSAE